MGGLTSRPAAYTMRGITTPRDAPANPDQANRAIPRGSLAAPPGLCRCPIVKPSIQRVRIFVDYWNFQLSLSRGARKRVDWEAFGPALTRAVGELFSNGESCRFEGLHVVGSYNPEKDGKLKKFFDHALALFPGVKPVLLERQKKSNPPACPACRATVPTCPNCGENMLGTEEKGVDTRLVTDMIRLAWSDSYDVAVLVSADKDFVPVVEFLESRGLKIIHGRFPRTGNHLSKVCWGRLDLIPLLPSFERSPKRPAPSLPPGENR